jgi:hypothetical protein
MRAQDLGRDLGQMVTQRTVSAAAAIADTGGDYENH